MNKNNSPEERPKDNQGGNQPEKNLSKFAPGNPFGDTISYSSKPRTAAIPVVNTEAFAEEVSLPEPEEVGEEIEEEPVITPSIFNVVPEASENLELPPPESKAIRLRGVLTTIGVVLGVVVLIFAGMFISQKSREVEVPSAPERTVVRSDKACENFSEIELDCSVGWSYSERPEGTLISQSLEANSIASKGDSIVLEYSLGVEMVSVPELIGMDLESAKKSLSSLGLSLGTVEEREETGVASNVVVESSVNSGEVVETGSIIDVVVSSGKWTVPNWVGKPTEVVVIEADALGIDVIYLEQEDAGPSGVVLQQSIPAGEITKDQEIEVTVSKSVVTESAEVPDVIGKNAEEAQVTLAAAGFEKIKVVEIPSTATPGVFQTVPGVGQTTPLSETIVVIVTVAESKG